ncbi:MAG: hypothetical protein HY814_03910, partial [Candidatus Riflebacteria bacterium]|nr:hypothetical protein [Candidatus Riflebacteria bacterium]
MAQTSGQMTIDDAAARLGVDRTDVVTYLWELGLAARYDTMLDAAQFEGARKHFARVAGDDEPDDPRAMEQALREAPRPLPPEDDVKSPGRAVVPPVPQATPAKAMPMADGAAARPAPGPRPAPPRTASFEGPRPARKPMPGSLSKPPEPEGKEPQELPKRVTGFDGLSQVRAQLPKGKPAAGAIEPGGAG